MNHAWVKQGRVFLGASAVEDGVPVCSAPGARRVPDVCARHPNGAKQGRYAQPTASSIHINVVTQSRRLFASVCVSRLEQSCSARIWRRETDGWARAGRWSELVNKEVGSGSEVDGWA